MTKQNEIDNGNEEIGIYLATPHKPHKKWREWMGLYAIDKTNNELWLLPESIGLSQMKFILCAGYDGTPMLKTSHKNKQYLLAKSSWLLNEIKKNINKAKKLQKMINDIYEKHNLYIKEEA